MSEHKSINYKDITSGRPRRTSEDGSASPCTSPRRGSDITYLHSPRDSSHNINIPRRKTLPANSLLCGSPNSPLSQSPTFSRYHIQTPSRYSTSPQRSSEHHISPLCHSPHLGQGFSHSGSMSPGKASPLSSPAMKKRGGLHGALSSELNWKNMSPGLRRRVFSDLPNDMDGEATMGEWYKKHNLGPEMLADMPLVRKIYMSNLEREVDRDFHPKVLEKPSEEELPAVEETELPERYRGRRLSSLFSKEAQMASLGIYESEMHSSNPGDEYIQDPVNDQYDPEHITERLQKAMYTLDMSLEHQDSEQIDNTQNKKPEKTEKKVRISESDIVF